MVIPSSALGLDGATPPSERVRVAGIGIGRRGEYDLGCFLQQPDVQFVAICDVKEARRQAVKGIADKHTAPPSAAPTATIVNSSTRRTWTRC